MRVILIFLSSVFLFGIAHAQTDSLQHYKNKAEALFDDANYKKACNYYDKLAQAQPKEADIQFRLGYCYLQSGQTVAKSVPYFEKAAQLFSRNNLQEESNTALFYQAQAYHKSYQFDQAETLYKEVIQTSENKEIIKSAEEGIQEVKEAKDHFFNPQPLQVTRYGILNSKFDDHSPVISADEKVLMFTSRRPGNIGGELTASGEPYEDIYVFREGQHQRPVNIDRPVNTKYHDATCGLSADGNELFVYRATKKDGGDIFHSIFDGKKWTEPQRLGSNINTKYRETHASLSADGKQLYITSDRKGGFGGFDIYVSQKQPDGTWGPAQNLGSAINTEKDEIGPYIHPDGITLYFSSNGHPGMGGYDVFFSEIKENGDWYEPENIGFPLNTVAHDVFFVPTADGKGGYYASQKDGSTNIYKATFLAKPEKNISLVAGYVRDLRLEKRRFDADAEKSMQERFKDPESGDIYPDQYQYNEKSKTFRKAEVSGGQAIFTDSILTVPPKINIQVFDIQTGKIVKNFKAAEHNGRYLITLTKQKDYKLIFEADNYIFNAFNIRADQQEGFYKLNKNAELDKADSKHLKATRTIAFELGLTGLTDFAKTELDYLSNYMKQYNNLLLDISGCDYLVYEANPDYRRLECEYANARMRKVKKYLTDKGIENDRIFTNTFPVHHSGDTLAYTLFNKKQAEKEKEKKEERKQTFEVVKVEANLNEDEIIEKYGTISTERQPYITQDMLFKINRYRPSSEYENSLQQLADYLKSDPDIRIRITGYTDLQGNKDYNYRLSGKRAETVKQELIKRGVSKNQIETQAKGFENPIALNKTKEDDFHWDALVYNRRVEIKVLKSSPESELFVQQIEVPKKYIRKKEKNTENNQARYAIGLQLSTEQKALKDFEGITGISEKQYSNGTYLYFFGNYTKREEVLDNFFKIRRQYPEAFIFLR